MNTYDLSGRVAIITGATGGIGTALATEFYKQGASLALTGRDPDALLRLSDKLTEDESSDAPAPLCICADLTAIDAPRTIVQRAAEHFGRLDILVNNAAIIEGQMFLKTSESFLNKMTHTNYTVPYQLSQNALPYMLKQKFGRLIYITSVAGCMGDAGMSAYAGSKAAVAGMAKSVATEYGRRNITANCIAPGIVDTQAIKKLPPERQKALKEMIPARRFAQPEEIAYLAVFLASERAAYINGQQIHINGGLVR